MKLERRSAQDERKILVGMILDRIVLSRIASRWAPPGLFRTPWCNLIGGWCVEYLNRYDSPPGKAIESLFYSWSETSQDETSSKLIATFLESLAEESEDTSINSEYLVDLAGRHFNSVQLESLADGIQSDLTSGQILSATERVSKWNRLELGAGAGIEVLSDMDAIRSAFETKSEPLIQFPGALGEFFGGSLERDGFIGVMGPDKRGKSFWLSEMAYRALLARRKVAFFECGDLSQDQIMRRLMCRISRIPLQPGAVPYPRSIQRERGSRVASVELEDKQFETSLSWRKAWKACQKLLERKVKTQQSMWKLSCHPNSTLTVSGIRSILSGWERDGWTPDVVVVDYADILGSDHPKMDYRHQINETWKALRALSQSLHCLLLTASQTDADAYRRNTITRSNFSEDKRKLAHVTGMIGLNQTPEEAEQGIIRLNWIVRRESAFRETQCVHVAGALGLANPAVVSCW